MAPIFGKEYHAQGKLLLTGEYFVLDGALALALPTRLGQHFTIETGVPEQLSWQSFDSDGTRWFQAVLSIPELKILSTNAEESAQRLVQVLREAFKRSKFTVEALAACQVSSHLDFSRHWGLGTSSTLVSFVANLAHVDPYELLTATFGGSGYDLACAEARGPIFYQNQSARPAVFQPNFADQLYFVYLGKKQNSREGIQRYRALGEVVKSNLERVNQLTLDFAACQSLDEFENLIVQHEALVSETLGLTRAQALHFADYWGQIKSLGAWGGDFVLVTSNRDVHSTKAYFAQKGFSVFLPYHELVL